MTTNLHMPTFKVSHLLPTSIYQFKVFTIVVSLPIPSVNGHKVNCIVGNN